MRQLGSGMTDAAGRRGLASHVGLNCLRSLATVKADSQNAFSSPGTAAI